MIEGAVKLGTVGSKGSGRSCVTELSWKAGEPATGAVTARGCTGRTGGCLSISWTSRIVWLTSTLEPLVTLHAFFHAVGILTELQFRRFFLRVGPRLEPGGRQILLAVKDPQGID